MTVFIIIAVIGFLGHIASVILYGVANYFSNRDAYEPDESISFFDSRMLSLSTMLFGISGWISIKLLSMDFTISLPIGLAVALLSEVIGKLISIIYNVIISAHYRQLSKEWFSAK